MALKVERVDGGPERMVVTACVVNKVVLGQVAAKWTPNAFPNRWANLVVGWAVEYYREWKRAPGTDISIQYDEWRAKAADPPTVELVGNFLQAISDEYRKLKDSISPDYVINLAAGLMQRVRLVEANARLASWLEAGELDKAAAEFAKYRPVELGSAAWLDMSDRASVLALITATRASRTAPLIDYPDALGGFYGRALERDGFIAFLGYEKGQKSFCMQDLAWRAVRQGRRVAYFEAGDMSKGQVVTDRFVSLTAGRPILGDPHHAFPVPKSIDSPGSPKGRPTIEYDYRWHKKDMTDEESADSIVRLAGPPGGLRLVCHPNSTLSVPGIEGYLEAWERDAWIPDVIVVDYADILAPIDPKMIGLDRINETWKALRATSQRHNCLVVTATQARRDSATKWLMDREDVSDEKRKLAHVTGLVGINRCKADIDQGVWRFNWIVGRNTKLSADTFVWTAGNLDFACPTMVSTF